MKSQLPYLLFVAALGCSSNAGSDAACDDNTPCTDPTRPFCDVAGQYPASQGMPNTCIPDPSGGNADAAPPPDSQWLPDAGMAQLRRGVITVAELVVSNDFTLQGISEAGGALVSVSYLDLRGVAVAPSTGVPGAAGDCTVYVYEVGTTAPPGDIDEGTVTVTGDGLTPATLPACAHNPQTKSYECVRQAPTPLPVGSTWTHKWNLTNNHQTTSVLTIPGADFTNAEGMLVTTSGYAPVDHDSNATTPAINVHNGSFGINIVDPNGTSNTTQVRAVNPIAARLIEQAYATALDGQIANENLANTKADLMAAILSQSYTAPAIDAGPSAPNSWSVVAGRGPIIQLAYGLAPFDFIADATKTVTITKTAGDVVGGFTITTPLAPAGEGLTLADASAKPHEFPTSAIDWALTCAGAGGNCGGNGDGQPTYGFRIAGITTDAPLSTACNDNPDGKCAPVDMPPPVTKWAEFTCIGVHGTSSIEVASEDIAAILGTNPTRIRTQLVRAVVDDRVSNEATTIRVGHGLVGFTDL